MSGNNQSKSIDFWKDFSSALISVADIAVKIVPMFVGKSGAEPAFIDIGPIRFSTTPTAGGDPLPWAKNNSDADFAVLLNAAPASNHTQSVYRPLAPGETAHFKNGEFHTFALGGITIARTAPGDAKQNSWRLLSGAMSAVGFAAAAQIFPGFTITVGPNPNGSGNQLKLEKQSTAKILRVKGIVKDTSGNAASIEADMGAVNAEDPIIAIPISDGVHPNPSYEIYLEIKVDEPGFRSVVQASQ